MAAGYPDFRNQADNDQAFLVDRSDLTGAGPFLFGPFYVGNFANIAVQANSADFTGKIVLVWFKDAGGFTITGRRAIPIDPIIGQNPKFSIPNQGPYVQVQMIMGGSTVAPAVLRAWGSNSRQPNEVEPQFRLPIDFDATSIGAGTTTTVTPTDYATREITVLVIGTQTGQFDIDVLRDETFNNYTTIARFVTDANGLIVQRVGVSTGAWRVKIKNLGGAAGTFNLRCQNLH